MSHTGGTERPFRCLSIVQLLGKLSKPKNLIRPSMMSPNLYQRCGLFSTLTETQTKRFQQLWLGSSQESSFDTSQLSCHTFVCHTMFEQNHSGQFARTEG